MTDGFLRSDSPAGLAETPATGSSPHGEPRHGECLESTCLGARVVRPQRLTVRAMPPLRRQEGGNRPAGQLRIAAPRDCPSLVMQRRSERIPQSPLADHGSEQVFDQARMFQPGLSGYPVVSMPEPSLRSAFFHAAERSPTEVRLVCSVSLDFEARVMIRDASLACSMWRLVIGRWCLTFEAYR